MDNALLASFCQVVTDQKLNVTGVRVETKSGDIAFCDLQPAMRRNIWSCAKTFASLGVGICVDDGLFSLDDKVVHFFPDYAHRAAPGTDAVTIRDLLHMAPGKRVLARPYENIPGADWLDVFLTAPMVAKPNEIFFYSSLYTYMLGRVVEVATGQNMRDFLVSRLFEPMDIANPQWDSCPLGHTICAKHLYLTTEELSRLGRLFLNDGEYKGRRLISHSYLDAMIHDVFTPTAMDTPDPETEAGYGLQLWRGTSPGSYRAYGMGGNFCILLPDKAAAITITADHPGNHHDVYRAAMAHIVSLL